MLTDKEKINLVIAFLKKLPGDTKNQCCWMGHCQKTLAEDSQKLLELLEEPFILEELREKLK